MTHFSIRKWEDYQHYKDATRPIWVKFYVKLLEDEGLRSLSVPTRLMANLLLLVAANKNNRIPANVDWLSVELGMSRRNVGKGLEELLELGYLVRSSPEQNRVEEKRSSNKQRSYVVPELAVEKLLRGLEDKDPTTKRTVVAMCKRHRLAEGDLMWALECANGPGVESPTRVAVAELKKRGEGRQAA